MDDLVYLKKEKVKGSKACTHSRMIDDVYDQDGTRTGKMQCLECMAILDDPLNSGEDPDD